MSGRPIGELNGRWAFLLKVTVVCVPLVTSMVTAIFVPWAVWVTNNIYVSQRYHVVAERVITDIDRLENTVAQLPPPEWKSRIVKLEDCSKEMRDENARDHSVIMISLAEIRSQLGQKQQ